MPASELFERQVAHALMHLYDPDVLISHPLLEQFGLKNGTNPAADLHNLLIKSIEALKPPPSAPITSRMWRVYNLLNLRYVQQQEQEQTAYQLGIGVRHLRREQKNAIQILSETLAQKYSLKELHPEPAVTDSLAPLKSEISWMRSSYQETSASVSDLLRAVIHLVSPLAEANKVQLDDSCKYYLPTVAISPASLRQALIVLISNAISRVPKGKVYFSTEVIKNTIILKIIARLNAGILTDETAENEARLTAARALLNTDENCLSTSEKEDELIITLRLPIAAYIKVCLLDDNADIGELFERYLAGTQYVLSSAQNTDNLFEWLEEQNPQVIILDVMMPGLDGWEILGRLKQHPQTSSTPVIICSALPERDLAIALGATAYLPKPTNRATLLETLNQIKSVKPEAPR
jgi:CheY-like chemotaxis protein